MLLVFIVNQNLSWTIEPSDVNVPKGEMGVLIEDAVNRAICHEDTILYVQCRLTLELTYILPYFLETSVYVLNISIWILLKFVINYNLKTRFFSMLMTFNNFV